MVWHSGAKRVIIPGAIVGGFVLGCKPKVVWHTTEGTFNGLETTYRSTGDIPHFSIGLERGKRVLWQHAPISQSVSALEHPAGTPDTNRARAYQVEVVEFARNADRWSDELYHSLNLLAKWFNRHADVPLTTDVVWRHPTRMSGREFLTYTGHCGHVHAPNQRKNHQDPGPGFHIGKVLKK